MLAMAIIYLTLSCSVAAWAAKRGRDFRTKLFICIAISPIVVAGSVWTS